jgi:acetyl-CoA C-acetyltransferase
MACVILSAVRTPIGKFLGGLSQLSAPQLGSLVIAEAMTRANVATTAIDEVIFGNVVQAGVGQAPARQAALAAGLPETIAAVTINKVCGSGLKAVILADQVIRSGDATIIVAGGMESMSQAPFLLPGIRQGYSYGNRTVVDALLHDGLWCPFNRWAMGDAAEALADRCGITRIEQDQFAVNSHQRAAAAWESGAFSTEVIPVSVGSGAKARVVAVDEGIRPETTMDSLAGLKPVFRADNGSVTAGNASQLSDGAAAVVVASESVAASLGRKPLARIIATATSGVPPRDIFLAPVLAIRQVLSRAGLRLEEIDLFEINEAFAVQMIACERELGLDRARVNVHGGAVALGHPIGASGARVLVTLIHALHKHQARYGLASLCLGGGNAVAMVIERIDAAE